MTEIEQQIEDLTKLLQELRSRQVQMNAEMVSAERKLAALKAVVFQNASPADAEQTSVPANPIAQHTEAPYILQAKKNIEEKKAAFQKKPFYVNHELEDFIGTNIISKIGILVTIIGVFIGAKYAIDNELISPLMRIVAGYLAGAALISIAFRLKKKYEYFSSILIGGGLAVTYFITYIAFSFYALFSLPVAFALMVVTTIVAVGIALWYNQKVIALLGQVAAYAIPFLLSTGQGNIFVLFGYITVINIGLLLLSFKKDWKLLYHIAFFLTWSIYMLSIVVSDKVTSFTAGLTFLTINFFTFYITFLAYKIFKKELYQLGEIGILLLNALFFFFLGTYLINDQFTNIHFLTWFTITNACIHLAAGYAIYKLNLVDKSVFQFILGLGLLFVTVAIPIELDGNWVTLLWTLEATLLTFVAYNTRRELYLDIALPLVIISFISLLQDWYTGYPFIRGSISTADDFKRTPFININFTLSIVVCACIATMCVCARRLVQSHKSFVLSFFGRVLPVAFLVMLYITLYNEIHFVWDKEINLQQGKGDLSLQSVTLMIFSLLYFAAWLFGNTYKIKNEKLHHLLLALALLSVATFLVSGLYSIGELREQYIVQHTAPSMYIVIRYLAFAALAVLWLTAWKAFIFFKPDAFLQRVISGVFNLTLLAVISNEFVHWMDLAGYQNQYKLGLSLICGGYALALLFAGIINNKKHLRISSMVLFAGTLLKLFFYDLASLSTISKTIVLVLLGILLLLASFLYNKYKDVLFAKGDSQQ